MSADTAFVLAAACGITSIYLTFYVLARIPKDVREFKRERKRRARQDIPVA